MDSDMKLMLVLEKSNLHDQVTKMSKINKCKNDFPFHIKAVNRVAKNLYDGLVYPPLNESMKYTVLVNDNRVLFFGNGWPILKCSVKYLAKYGGLISQIDEIYKKLGNV